MSCRDDTLCSLLNPTGRSTTRWQCSADHDLSLFTRSPHRRGRTLSATRQAASRRNRPRGCILGSTFWERQCFAPQRKPARGSASHRFGQNQRRPRSRCRSRVVIKCAGGLRHPQFDDTYATVYFVRGEIFCRCQFYSITSSARASTVAGRSRPIALALFRLITISYFVGTCTGRSAGFSPLRMRST